MDEKCAFEDPELMKELVSISNKLREPLRAHGRRVQIFVWLLFLATLIPVLVLKRAGASLTVPGWRGVVLLFIAPVPLIGIVLWQILGEKRVKMRVYRMEGLYCLSCGRVPTDSGDDSLEDWLACGRCPHCDGPLERFETKPADLPEGSC